MGQTPTFLHCCLFLTHGENDSVGMMTHFDRLSIPLIVECTLCTCMCLVKITDWAYRHLVGRQAYQLILQTQVK